MAEKFPATLRRNGLKMVTVNLEAHLTVEQIAAHVTNMIAYDIDHFPASKLDDKIRKLLKSRQAVMAYVKDSLLTDGSQLPHYHITDNPTCDAIYPYVVTIIDELWS